jgi:hypothetical protein
MRILNLAASSLFNSIFPFGKLFEQFSGENGIRCLKL